MRTLSFLLLLSYASTLFARDLYVDNLGGSDIVNGRAPASAGAGVGPVKTIAKALRLSQPGDRIYLANTGEPYREMVTLQGAKNSGLHGDAPLVIEGNGAVIEGTTPVPENAWQSLGGGVFRAACLVKSHQVLFLQTTEGDWQGAKRIRLSNASDDRPQLKEKEYFVWDGEIYFRVEPTRTPQSYEPQVAGLTTGLTLYDVQNVIIKNLTIQGFAFDGVSAPDNVKDVRLENVISRDNGRSGFSLGGYARLTLDRCEANSNHTAQVRVEDIAEVVLQDCQLDATSAPEVVNEGGKVLTKEVK